MEELFVRMESDLKQAGLGKATRDHYLKDAREFIRHYDCPPEVLGEREVRAWLQHLRREKDCRAARLNQYLIPLRFLFSMTLGRPEVTARLLPPHEPGPIPKPLSGEELDRFVAAIEPGVYRRAVAAAFGGGMLLHEAGRLRVGDIDSRRMLLRLRALYGKWDAHIPLDDPTLETLREQWRESRPREGLLFTVGPERAPFVCGRVEEAMRPAAHAAGLAQTPLGPALRYSFLLRRMRQGAGLRETWHLLRHTSIRRLPAAAIPQEGARP